jgi:ribosomal protein L11 methyltransferase
LQYIRATYRVEDATSREVLIAVLSGIGFTAFEESGADVHACIPSVRFDPALAEDAVRHCGLSGIEAPKVEVVEEENWNAAWEAQFQPLLIADRIFVRASFHDPGPEKAYDIVIDPKMSFGTGHHETTHLMLECQLDIDHTGRKVLDVGTGTGILSVFAHKRGAGVIEAIDTDEWSIHNCRENFKLNRVQNHTIHQGTIQNLTLDHDFDIILANINRNVILDEIGAYADHLADEGMLLISGFYAQDSGEIARAAGRVRFRLLHQKERNGWAVLLFTREK